MDPNACLRRFLDACDDDDRTEAMEAIADLYTWIAQSGALPTVTSDDCSPSERGMSMPYYVKQS